jgi:hypothetical protein
MFTRRRLQRSNQAWECADPNELLKEATSIVVWVEKIYPLLCYLMRSLIRLLWALVVVCLIYALSIGPAVILEEKKIISKPSFEFVYSPLEKTVKKSPPAERALESYIRLWKHKDK